MRRPVLAGLFAALAASGCTLILDRGRHLGEAADARADGGSSVDLPDAAEHARDDAHGADAAVLPTSPDAGADAGPPCDGDGDGHRALACGGDDCDDTDATTFPFAPPICGNGRAESCSLGEQSELLTLLGAAEVGVLPRVVVARDLDVAPEVVGAVTAGPAMPHGLAFVAYRRRGAEAYAMGSASIDLETGAVTDWSSVVGEGLFARALGAGDLGGLDLGYAHLAAVATSPDQEEQRGLWLTAFPDGSGSSGIAFPPEARRAVALVGTEGEPSAIVFAGDDRLVRYSLGDASVFEVPLSSALSVPRVRGDGAGPYAVFTALGGGVDLVWDLAIKACGTDADCPAPATCGADGACRSFSAPRDIVLDERAPGDWIDVSYAGSELWFVHASSRVPGLVHLGTLDCAGPSCVADRSSSLVLGDGGTERPVIAPISADARVVAAVVGTPSGTAIRVAFHQLSTSRQIAPIEHEDTWDLSTGAAVVEDLHGALSVQDDPRLGRVTTLLLTVAEPSSTESLWTTGLRACERL